MTNKLERAGINWVIIGAQTNPYKPPEIEWVKEIVRAADKAGIPVFLKDNLNPLILPNTVKDTFNPTLTYKIEYAYGLRQEMPEWK